MLVEFCMPIGACLCMLSTLAISSFIERRGNNFWLLHGISVIFYELESEEILSVQTVLSGTTSNPDFEDRLRNLKESICAVCQEKPR